MPTTNQIHKWNRYLFNPAANIKQIEGTAHIYIEQCWTFMIQSCLSGRKLKKTGERAQYVCVLIEIYKVLGKKSR